ncbi:MAG: hypothetical protein QNJ51_20460 [Calothrix sp. MO_167.B12]|nr:hypothetical protein [Calothrix sp. MO_167.B12]
MKYVLPLLVLITSFFLVNPTAEASMPICHNYNRHKICILSIKRSAKNYWEYRATVSVDGVTQPPQVYNCRNRTKLQDNGKILQFQPNDPGVFICSFFRNSG